MTTTSTQTKRNSVSGSKITAYVELTFGTAYPANGEPFDATAFGVGVIDEVRITVPAVAAGLYVFTYIAADKKVRAFGSTTQATGAAVSEGDGDLAGGMQLKELAHNSGLLDGLKLDIAITGGR